MPEGSTSVQYAGKEARRRGGRGTRRGRLTAASTVLMDVVAGALAQRVLGVLSGQRLVFRTTWYRPAYLLTCLTTMKA